MQVVSREESCSSGSIPELWLQRNGSCASRKLSLASFRKDCEVLGLLFGAQPNILSGRLSGLKMVLPRFKPGDKTHALHLARLGWILCGRLQGWSQCCREAYQTIEVQKTADPSSGFMMIAKPPLAGGKCECSCRQLAPKIWRTAIAASVRGCQIMAPFWDPETLGALL